MVKTKNQKNLSFLKYIIYKKLSLLHITLFLSATDSRPEQHQTKKGKRKRGDNKFIIELLYVSYVQIKKQNKKTKKKEEVVQHAAWL